MDKAINKQVAGDDVDLTKLKLDCKELYASYIETVETGRELDDLLKYDSRDVLKSVYDRIVALDSSGVFKPTMPRFDPAAPIWRYDIRALNADEQKMFVDVLAEGLFLAAKRKGERAGYDTFLVIDEAHNFVSDDPTHITSIISKEARKFGMGMVLASQSLSHFPEDIIGNAATKVILGIDEMYHEQTAKKLRIEAKRLGWIVPKQSALIQIKTGDMANRYMDVMLP